MVVDVAPEANTIYPSTTPTLFACFAIRPLSVSVLSSEFSNVIGN